jgi:hypothetical protein
LQPKEFFDSNPQDLDEVVNVVRNGFGRNLDYKDIYEHATSPENLLLIRDKEIKGMASYNRKVFSGFPCLVLEGVALDPSVQGKGVFGRLIGCAYEKEKVICARTQNPQVYSAMGKFCISIYPNKEPMPEAIKAIQKEFATYSGCKIEDKGIVRGYYGGLFYGVEPKHPTMSSLFREELGMDLHRGDAILLVGII